MFSGAFECRERTLFSPRLFRMIPSTIHEIYFESIHSTRQPSSVFRNHSLRDPSSQRQLFTISFQTLFVGDLHDSQVCHKRKNSFKLSFKHFPSIFFDTPSTHLQAMNHLDSLTAAAQKMIGL